MRKYKLKGEQKELILDIEEAVEFHDRLMGLMFRKNLDEKKGMLIKKCNSIHTFFMRFNLDILFMDKDFKIIKVIKNMRPWRMTRVYFKACQVLELKGGTLSKEFNPTEKLEVLCIS